MHDQYRRSRKVVRRNVAVEKFGVNFGGFFRGTVPEKKIATLFVIPIFCNCSCNLTQYNRQSLKSARPCFFPAAAMIHRRTACVGRDFDFAAGNFVIQQEKKRTIVVERVGLVAFNEIHGGFRQQVRNVLIFVLRIHINHFLAADGLSLGRAPINPFAAGFVVRRTWCESPHIIGVKIFPRHSDRNNRRIHRNLFPRCAAGIFIAQIPFTDQPGAIAGIS